MTDSLSGMVMGCQRTSWCSLSRSSMLLRRRSQRTLASWSLTSACCCSDKTLCWKIPEPSLCLNKTLVVWRRSLYLKARYILILTLLCQYFTHCLQFPLCLGTFPVTFNSLKYSNLLTRMQPRGRGSLRVSHTNRLEDWRTGRLISSSGTELSEVSSSIMYEAGS